MPRNRKITNYLFTKIMEKGNGKFKIIQVMKYSQNKNENTDTKNEQKALINGRTL
jgi:hypothetical protein